MWEEISTAPGPAAFSANGNGGGFDAQPENPNQLSPVDEAVEWIATAPPLAILMVSFTGAIAALIFVWVGRIGK